MDVITIGLSTTIIGMTIVFAVLCIIALMLYLMQYISGGKNPSDGGPGEASKKNEEAAITVKATPENKINADLIAVITAAVAAAMNTSEDRLIVRSLRKASPWINTARSERA